MYVICPEWLYAGPLYSRQVLELPTLVSLSRQLGWLWFMFASFGYGEC